MFDTSFLLDVLFSGIASICAGFLVYGGWLCVGGHQPAGTRDAQQPPGSNVPDQPRMPSQSASSLT
jgi:hypothetical protein